MSATGSSQTAMENFSEAGTGQEGEKKQVSSSQNSHCCIWSPKNLNSSISECPLSDISANITLAECGYQILVTKICNAGMISYIVTNFISNICALNSKHLLYNKSPSAGQTTKLHNFISLVQAFFLALKNSFNVSAYQRTYTQIPTYLQ